MRYVHPFTLTSAAEVKSRLGRIGPFWAMLLTVLALAALSAALFLVSLLALGFPQFPRPDKLSGSQLLELAKVCLAVSVGVGGVVALVVAYRKQRDTEGRRESDSFAQALKDLDAESVFTRLSAVHSLTGLADSWPQWRQDCVDALCTALVQPPSAQDPAGRVADVISRTLRNRLGGANFGWQGVHVVLQGDVPLPVDLTGLVLDPGKLSLRDMHIPPATTLDLQGLTLGPGATFEVRDVTVRGTLKVSQLQGGDGSLTRLLDVTVEDEGQLYLDSATIAPEARVELVRTTLLRNAKLRLNGTVSGRVFLIRLLCAPESTLDMDHLAINAGTFSIVGWDQARDAKFTASHLQVGNSGFFGIFDARLDGRNHVVAMRLKEGATWIIERTSVYGRLTLDGAYCWSGSRLLVNLTGIGRLSLRGVEVEGSESALDLTARVDEPDAAVKFGSGGGFYSGHAHIGVDPIGRPPENGQLHGSVTGLGDLNSFDAMIAYDVFVGRDDLPIEVHKRFKRPPPSCNHFAGAAERAERLEGRHTVGFDEKFKERVLNAPIPSAPSPDAD